jgi:hypothetical protein
MKAVLYPPNAMLYVLDVGNKGITVPEYSNDALIGVSSSCVSVATRSEVDGDVTIILGTELPSIKDSELAEIFSGVITTPSSKIAVVTSELEKIVEIDVEHSKTKISILAEDSQHPRVIVVKVDLS